MNKILLQCDNLSKRYQEGTVQTDVLHNVSFSVGEGEMMAIVGSSGSGKSTLLHLLGGLDTPTEGDVIFSGQPLSKMSSTAKASCVTVSWALSISSTICCRTSRRWKTWRCR